MAINAILYTPRGKRWAMTERGRSALDRGSAHLGIGRSRLSVEGNRLAIDIDEWTVPVPSRLKGRVTVDLRSVNAVAFPIDAGGRHHWRPIAPAASVSVAFDSPAIEWTGTGYVDHNRGDEPLEVGFSSWTWCRSEEHGRTRIFYDTTPRQGAPQALALHFGEDGSLTRFEPPPMRRLGKTGWRIARAMRGDACTPPAVVRTLEDTPFYARSLIETTLGGERLRFMHESVDLDRFASRWVQTLLPFRMPRRTGWRLP